MCGGLLGGGSKPAPLPPLPETPKVTEPPQLQDPNVRSSRLNERKRLRALKGSRSTIATSASGLETEASTGKTTLGG